MKFSVPRDVKVIDSPGEALIKVGNSNSTIVMSSGVKATRQVVTSVV